MFAVKTGI